MMPGDKKTKSVRRRRLTDEEIALWLKVAASVERRPGAILPAARLEPHPKAPETPVAVNPAPAASAQAPPSQPRLPRLAPLERKVRQRLSRGQISADAAIDLHGFRQAEAHSALRHFLHRSQRDGARIVLVVTGKGRRRDDDMGAGDVGVLKRSVPLWLAEPALRAIVVGFEDAGRAHGGAGALYVRLRRPDRRS